MHPIENILETTMSELKQMVDVNTIVGDAFVTPNGCTIIPISKLSFGFVSGGGEYGLPDHKGERDVQPDRPRDLPFAGGTASGVSITPVAFMVADKDNIKLLAATQRSVVDKVLENIPQMMTEIKDMCKKEQKQTNGQEQ